MISRDWELIMETVRRLRQEAEERPDAETRHYLEELIGRLEKVARRLEGEASALNLGVRVDVPAAK
jgi:DNA-binding ferritin-like protein